MLPAVTRTLYGESFNVLSGGRSILVTWKSDLLLKNTPIKLIHVVMREGNYLVINTFQRVNIHDTESWPHDHMTRNL